MKRKIFRKGIYKNSFIFLSQLYIIGKKKYKNVQKETSLNGQKDKRCKMNKTEAKKRIEELREKTENYARKYYDDDKPEISDFEYDMLMVE